MPPTTPAVRNPTSSHPGTRVGAVHLRVRDLPRAIAFYSGRLGLVSRSVESAAARLGTVDRDLLVLHGNGWTPKPRGSTGLYHFAVLFPTRRDLGRMLRRLVESRVALDGASDHAVSEALYLRDPEGNGIELYRDRPRAEWQFEDGQVRMTSDPLDVDGLLAEGEGGGPDESVPAATTIGHIHLQVSDLDGAERFYAEVLGLDRMARLARSASFLAANGYHHHIGLNVWAGIGAPPPPADATGLDHFEIVLSERGAIDRVMERARAAGIQGDPTEAGFRLVDPSGNALVVRTGG